MYSQSGQQPLRYPGQSYQQQPPQPQQHGYNPNYNQSGNVGGGGWMPPQSQNTQDSEVMLWFQAVDVDRSGRITATELRQALTNANWSLFSEDACRLMIGLFDHDQSKSIDIHEFQQLWRYIQDWTRVFSQVDQNGSGYIENNELHQALVSMGYQFSPQFIQLVINKFDSSRQNRLTLDSFIMCCVILQQLTENFKQKDVERKGQIRINYDDFMIMALPALP